MTKDTIKQALEALKQIADNPGNETYVYLAATDAIAALSAEQQEEAQPNNMVPVEEVKQLCRDFSSRTGSVYIKDVEGALDGLADLYAAPPAVAAVQPQAEQPVAYALKRNGTLFAYCDRKEPLLADIEKYYPDAECAPLYADADPVQPARSPEEFAKSITFTQKLALDERQRLVERISDLEAQLRNQTVQPASKPEVYADDEVQKLLEILNGIEGAHSADRGLCKEAAKIVNSMLVEKNTMVREFQEWLDVNRRLSVSEVFHEIVIRYSAALTRCATSKEKNND